MSEKGKALNSFFTQQYLSLRVNRLQTSHTLIQTKAAEICEASPAFQAASQIQVCGREVGLCFIQTHDHIREPHSMVFHQPQPENSCSESEQKL